MTYNHLFVSDNMILSNFLAPVHILHDADADANPDPTEFANPDPDVK